MRIALLTVVSVACFVSISASTRISRADAGDDELKKLQGTWKVVDENMYGESQMKDPERDAKVIFAGDSMMVFDKRDSLHYMHKVHNINPQASPSALDMTMKKDEKTVGEFPAVYKLDGDDLQICFWGKENNKPRPKKLETGKGLVLIVLKRMK